MEDEMDDWRKKFQAMRETNAKALAKLNEIRISQAKMNQDYPIENLSIKQGINKLNIFFLQLMNQQNQFHERFLGKLHEIVNALKK